MRVFVTGAGGHLGANLVRALLAQGHVVHALVRRDNPSLAGLELEVTQGDIMDAESMIKLVPGHDLVMHLAAIISIVGDPDGQVQAVNVQGTENVARACLASGIRLVHCSSVHAFDMEAHGDARLDESAPRVPPKCPAAVRYDLSKADGERVVRSLLEEGLDAVIAHPSGVIGPHDYAPSRMGHVFLDLYHGSLPALVQGGFDFVDVRDVVQALIACAEVGRTGESYLLSGQYATIPEFSVMATEVTGRRGPLFTSPLWLARATAPFFETYARVTGTEPLYTAESLATLGRPCDVDCSKAKRELGFAPRDLRESVADIYGWFDSAGMLR